MKNRKGSFKRILTLAGEADMRRRWKFFLKVIVLYTLDGQEDMT